MDSLNFGQENPAQELTLRQLHAEFEKCNIINDIRTRNNIRKAFSLLAELFPKATNVSFGSKELMQFQVFLAKKNYARKYCNTLVKFVRTVFYWGESADLVSIRTVHKLRNVKPLKLNQAKEKPKRKAVPAEVFEAALPYFPPAVSDMLELQRLTAMRPGEVCRMKPIEIKHDKDLTGDFWIYQPEHHKTEWAGKEKRIVLGENSMETLSFYLLKRAADEPVFKTVKGKAYTTASYGRIIKKVLEANDLPKFTAHQVRHLAISEISLLCGQDFAKEVAGHSDTKTTEIYDHFSIEKQKEVIRRRELQRKEK
ncbi:MAG: tyrosine-type recombinase/integrase [Planctomycetaceae bacterium]|nr:tyrosine-type recombinase/integrase [Planctomycetaceae bacterium]